MVSVTIMTLYIAFLTVAGGGDAVEAVVPEEFRSETAPFTEGGFFSILSDLAEITVGILKLVWNIVVLLTSIVTFDLEAFGLPTPTGLLRLLLATPITIMTIHIVYETVKLIRGVS